MQDTLEPSLGARNLFPTNYGPAQGTPTPLLTPQFNGRQIRRYEEMASNPPMYGRNTSGTRIEPSCCW